MDMVPHFYTFIKSNLNKKLYEIKEYPECKSFDLTLALKDGSDVWSHADEAISFLHLSDYFSAGEYFILKFFVEDYLSIMKPLPCAITNMIWEKQIPIIVTDIRSVKKL